MSTTNSRDFNEVVDLIVRHDRRYDAAAYYFMRQALDFTVRALREKKSEPAESRHVNGRELSEGIRDFALEQYGPMALALFTEWGIRCSRDFGEIVYNLIEYGIFGKTEQDSIEDFQDVYNFYEAFEAPFLPRRLAGQAVPEFERRNVP